MFIQKIRVFYLFCVVACFSAHSIFSAETVKVAVVHFRPYTQDCPNNIARILQLAEEAGSNGAKIIVFPELATSGYSYFICRFV